MDPEVQDCVLYKYQNPQGWVQYKVNGMADAYSRYRYWEIMQASAGGGGGGG